MDGRREEGKKIMPEKITKKQNIQNNMGYFTVVGPHR